MRAIEKQKFWDRKILKWEKDKYERNTEIGAVDVNNSVKYRLLLAGTVLKKVCAGKSVLEIGCGSAKLMPQLLESGALHYTGIDLSSTAIAQAKRIAEELRVTEKVQLVADDASRIKLPEADICFSLGLLDWLTFEDMESFLSRIQCRIFFHSFSERRASFQQLLHRMYVFCLYGHRTKSYVPQYFEARNIADLFQRVYAQEVNIYRSPKLSFGTILTNLPLDVFP